MVSTVSELPIQPTSSTGVMHTLKPTPMLQDFTVAHKNAASLDRLRVSRTGMLLMVLLMVQLMAQPCQL